MFEFIFIEKKINLNVYCDNIHNELAILKQHKKSQILNELVTCGICGKDFTEMYYMIEHKKNI